MPSGYSNVVIVGRLAANPYVDATHEVKVARVTVAVPRPYKDKTGNYVDHTDNVECVAFAGRADICQNYLRKGASVVIVGHVHVDERVNDAGVKRLYQSIVVDNIVFMSSGVQR